MSDGLDRRRLRKTLSLSEGGQSRHALGRYCRTSFRHTGHSLLCFNLDSMHFLWNTCDVLHGSWMRGMSSIPRFISWPQIPQSFSLKLACGCLSPETARPGGCGIRGRLCAVTVGSHVCLSLHKPSAAAAATAAAPPPSSSSYCSEVQVPASRL